MIYFDRILQDKVIALFDDALPAGGILCLGSKESLRFTSHQDRFETIDQKERIYKKKYQV
jgi:chemotaxis protein methyltransferase CheR